MTFFDSEMYLQIYGKPKQQVSPTEDPNEEFQITNLSCPECGQSLNSNCTLGVSVTATCEDCQIGITQQREYVVEDYDYQSRYKIIDEREMYLCPLCKDYHPITEVSSVEIEDLPSVGGYHNNVIKCVCGDTFQTPDSFDKSVECSSCYREYSLNLVEE